MGIGVHDAAVLKTVSIPETVFPEVDFTAHGYSFPLSIPMEMVDTMDNDAAKKFRAQLDLREQDAAQRAADAIGCGAFAELGMYLSEMFEVAEWVDRMASYGG